LNQARHLLAGAEEIPAMRAGTSTMSRDTGFEIRGIPQELLQKFSQRSRQRDQAVDVFFEQRGRRPTHNEIFVLVRESRADKLTEISTYELREKLRALTRIRSSERAIWMGGRRQHRADGSTRA
jgi:hypothetical protein